MDHAYWTSLAQTAERGCFDAVFLADGQSQGDITHGPLWNLEPLTLLSAMAAGTERIGLVCTIPASFYEPFPAARMLASLDHISGGRAGWNVVTSMFDAEAQNYGMDTLPVHAERYGRAAEFVQAALALWDSWDADAIRADPAGAYADMSKIRPVHHEGRHFRMAGPLNVPRSPQGRPVLFQAGASEDGRNLAARHAEGVYSVAADLSSAQQYYRDVKARAARAGRDPGQVVVMPGLVSYIGSTAKEAAAARAELDGLVPVAQSLAQLGKFIQQDCISWELDAPVPRLAPASEFSGPAGRYATILRLVETERPTVRQLLDRLAAGGGHCTMAGTPEQVADGIQHWFENGGADGFNLMPPVLPGSLEEFVDRVVPLLQRRGLFRNRYTTRTLRGHLLGVDA
ncbi:FMN-dependent oxidoreductase (nitrilotriacetate monooxygenase family) [Arthrobacter stackebrandtii]|uniref:FMN-dependent oxidoreductase (Nitrilotriacetate monooxygenase family) n=1 Tax=Arthrobacter stackebrandtii TaxID=272161 RepID=A0ABS4Z156_9MICC|nr:FMN-dependent oxidoreductase (nitrilotriacetate monooxygenase family) [Arthrobacter stackebrandtii]